MSLRQKSLRATPQESMIIEKTDNSSGKILSHPLIFVGGIPKLVSRAEVQSYLSTFGEIKYFSMPYYLHADNHKGFAKVYYYSSQVTMNILEMPCHKIREFPVAIIPWIGKSKFKSRKEQPSQSKLFAKFNQKVDQETLLEHFSTFGKVVKIEFKVNHNTNSLRNFCFIIYETQEQAAKALAHPVHKVGKCPVFVSLSKSWAELSHMRSVPAPFIESAETNVGMGSRQPIKRQQGLASKVPVQFDTRTIYSPVSLSKKSNLQSGQVRLDGPSSFHPVSFATEESRDHHIKPNSRSWHYEQVASNHQDYHNLLFKKITVKMVAILSLHHSSKIHQTIGPLCLMR